VEFSAFVRRVGANVRRARWAAGMTQEQVAAAVLTFRLLAELERGRGNPTLRTLFLLAQKLRVSVKDLVDLDAAGRLALTARKLVPPKRGRKPKPRRMAKAR
jgi:transcriptional regulator with XRE-family HTH domain